MKNGQSTCIQPMSKVAKKQSCLFVIYLGDDELVLIYRAACRTNICNMGGVCRGWRDALARHEKAVQSVIKELTFFKFPYMKSVVEKFPCVHHDFRRIYRDQVLAQKIKYPSFPEKESLADYVLTVMLKSDAERTVTYTGTAEDFLEPVKLWDDNDVPNWAVYDANEEYYPNDCEAMRLKMDILVAKLTPEGIKTIPLMIDGDVDEHAFINIDDDDGLRFLQFYGEALPIPCAVHSLVTNPEGKYTTLGEVIQDAPHWSYNIAVGPYVDFSRVGGGTMKDLFCRFQFTRDILAALSLLPW